MANNVFITPLKGTPYYSSTGIIKVFDNKDNLYNVGEICLERYDDQNFQYIFTPYWDSIKYIPNNVFFGIPGINLDLKREKYYRVNMTPCFISMRTPSESREDVKELLDKVGLDYYDRFEWMLRANMKCGDDNLIVIRKEQSTTYTIENLNIDRLSIDDIVNLDNLTSICKGNRKAIFKNFKILQSSAKIFIKEENKYLSSEEKNDLLNNLIKLI